MQIMQEKSSQSALAHPLLDTQQVILAHSSLIDESQFMQVTGGFMKSPQKAALVLFTLHVRPPPKNLLSRRRQFVPPLNQEDPLQASSKCPIPLSVMLSRSFFSKPKRKNQRLSRFVASNALVLPSFPFPRQGNTANSVLWIDAHGKSSVILAVIARRPAGRRGDLSLYLPRNPLLENPQQKQRRRNKRPCQSLRGSCNSLGSHSSPCSKNQGLDRFTLPA